jgi:hypothetical protein
MKKVLSTTCLSVTIICFCLCNFALTEETTPTEKNPLIQMAILLDTSGSMSGLIDQARAELWSIVNEFIAARKEGKAPEFQVALYEYGKSTLSQETGYIRMIVPFTTDLDKISEELFALTTNGGDEYCGWVIKTASESLEWSESPDDLKVIFIAGNEPFTQGPINYCESCKNAISKGIVVNTIHCGSVEDGINGKWKDGSLLADGKYLNIDHNREIFHVDAPQDTEIAELSQKLNDTYIAYGTNGSSLKQRQFEQDKNAAAVSAESSIQRAISKSSLHYENSSWDLVDALEKEAINLEEIKVEDLPEEMVNMSVAERKAYIQTKAKERSEIQQKIQTLNEQRKKYVVEEMKKQQNKTDTLGSAIVEIICKQAEAKNFKLKSLEQLQQNN